MNDLFDIFQQIPTGLIFGGIVAVFWLFGLILNKSSGAGTLARPSAEANQLAAIRRRMLEEQARQKQAATQRGRKGKRKPAPPTMPSPPRMPATPPVPSETPALPEMTSAAESTRHQPTETARNVRLLLQRNAAGEAFLLAEILGRPKALQDD
jgi:hypothetical protein